VIIQTVLTVRPDEVAELREIGERITGKGYEIKITEGAKSAVLATDAPHHVLKSAKNADPVTHVTGLWRLPSDRDGLPR